MICFWNKLAAASVFAVGLAVSISASEVQASRDFSLESEGEPRVGVQVKVETFSVDDARGIASNGFAFVRFGVWTDRLTDTAYLKRVASAFDLAARAGLPVLLTMRSTAPLADTPGASPERLESAGKQFGAQVRAVSQQYASQLIGVELWNEPDLSRYWPTGDVSETFPQFMRGVCASLAGMTPHVPIYGFGFSRAPVGHNMADELLSSALARSPACIDVVSYHAYGMTPRQIRDVALEVRNRYGLATAITEWGVPTQGSQVSSPENQASRFGAFVTSLDVRATPLVSIYEWKDTQRAATARERSFGLLDATGVPKRALAVVRAYLTGRTSAR
jgi:hypothetical protein